MSYDVCVMQWLIVKIDKTNKLMLETYAVLSVMRSKTKYYSILKAFHQV